MPISTPLTALLGIRHPILLAPMDVIAGARLTAAVSAAGGFGILGGGYGDRPGSSGDREAEEISPRRSASASSPGVWRSSRTAGHRARARSARDHAVVRRSHAVRAEIKSAGALLICQVQDEDMARQALDAGADILIAQGTEAGGHGASRTTIDIVPAIVDLAAGRVPVVAAGGIGDGRGWPR